MVGQHCAWRPDRRGAYLAWSVMAVRGVGRSSRSSSFCRSWPLVMLQRAAQLDVGDELPPLLVTISLSVIIRMCCSRVHADTHRPSRRHRNCQLRFPTISVSVLPLIQFGVAVLTIGGLQYLFYRTALDARVPGHCRHGEVAQLWSKNRMYSACEALSLVVAIAGVFIAIGQFRSVLGTDPADLRLRGGHHRGWAVWER